MSDKIKIADLFSEIPQYLAPLFERAEYPWEILPQIKAYIGELLENAPEGFSLLKSGVLIGKGAEISPLATVEPPAVIGGGTVVRPYAYIRGGVITGEGCVIGNSSELKNCVLLSRAQAPHYNYVGDSILGRGAHLGAGAICSNLRSDGQSVTVRGEKSYATGLRKLGAFVGDGAEVGCGCVLNPGTVIGKGSRIYPLTSVRGVLREGVILKAAGEAAEIEKDRQ
jgi:NDP-sugar pyrophosphorylase family protein